VTTPDGDPEPVRPLYRVLCGSQLRRHLPAFAAGKLLMYCPDRSPYVVGQGGRKEDLLTDRPPFEHRGRAGSATIFGTCWIGEKSKQGRRSMQAPLTSPCR